MLRENVHKDQHLTLSTTLGASPFACTGVYNCILAQPRLISCPRVQNKDSLAWTMVTILCARIADNCEQHLPSGQHWGLLSLSV